MAIDTGKDPIDLIVLGGGAAGIFGAIAAKTSSPKTRVLVLERHATLLAKVRISGGGRCNVTHACFEPKQLIQNYPRGSKELIGVFSRFGPKETIDWFAARGVELKREADGRMFPTTNSSETIIQCLLNEAKRVGVEILTKIKVEKITKEEGLFLLNIGSETFKTQALLLATGSSPLGYQYAKEFGHTIVPLVPSLFALNCPTSSLKELSGISLQQAELKIAGTTFSQNGPLLLTHFGFSGPAALKLSAFAARYFAEKEYRLDLIVNWLPALNEEKIYQIFLEQKESCSQKLLQNENPFPFPKALWKALATDLVEKKWGEIANHHLRKLAHKLTSDTFAIQGKTTHKEEFVTCGGVLLKEINFKKMESKIVPNLYFAGEILDIDGITGGFNFQNAWSTSYIAGSNL